jgi:hypothetical protein
MDSLVTTHIEPFYAEQAATDEHRLRRMRRVISAEPETDPDHGPSVADEPAYWQARAAVPFDPVAFRAFWKVMGMITVPGEVYANPAVIARAREVLGRRGTAPAAAAQPSRVEILAALT